MTADNDQLGDSGHGHSSVRFQQQFSQLEAKWAMMCKWLRLRHCASIVAAIMRSLEFLQIAAALSLLASATHHLIAPSFFGGCCCCYCLLLRHTCYSLAWVIPGARLLLTKGHMQVNMIVIVEWWCWACLAVAIGSKLLLHNDI